MSETCPWCDRLKPLCGVGLRSGTGMLVQSAHSKQIGLRSVHSSPSVQVAVLMRRERVPGAMSRWQAWRWVLHDVVGHDQLPPDAQGDTQPRCLRQTDDEQVWMHPGFTVSLHRDDAPGYYLNSTSPAPCWFVLWRMEEEPRISDEVMAVPVMVSLSYHDAGRWLDAQEQVEQVPAPEAVVAWLSAFAQEHWEAEPKRRKRPDSFKPLQDRFGKPASVSTGQDRGPRPGGVHHE